MGLWAPPQPAAVADLLEPEEVRVKGSVNIGTVIIRADRKWCADNAADATPAEHLNAIISAVEEQVGTVAVDRLRLELANTRTLLGKLVRAITGTWDAKGCLGGQVTEALRQVRMVERYLLSLQPTEEEAA